METLEATDRMDAMAWRVGAPRQRPLVVELIGPAGSGKTTLARALSRRDDFAVGLELPRIGHLPHLLHHTLLLLPVFVSVGGEGGWLSWKEMRSMTYVRAWPRELSRPTGRAVTVLDHGPLFRLARLRAFGPRITRSTPFERWWERSLGIWSEILDVVVALDAPDEVLVNRIRSRDENHRMKTGSRSEAERFLARYRSTYHEILRRLEGGPRLIRLDTSRNSPDEVVAAACEQLTRLVEAAAA